jgi:hypothetical protein
MELKKAASGAGRSTLALLKILVLGFWFGGGLLAGTIVARNIRHNLAENPSKAEDVAWSLVLSFTTVAAIAAAILAVLLFLLERKRRLWWIGLAVLAIVGAIDAYVIGAWSRSASDVGTRATLRTVHEGVFFAEVVAAFVLLAVLVFNRRPAPAAVIDGGYAGGVGSGDEEPRPTPPSQAPPAPSPPPASPLPSPPAPLPPLPEPHTPMGAGTADFDSSPFESPERPDVHPPAAPGERQEEGRGPEARPPQEGTPPL